MYENVYTDDDQSSEMLSGKKEERKKEGGEDSFWVDLVPTHIQYSSGWPCVYLQRDFSSNLTPLPGGFQGDVFNVLFMTRSNHSEWPQLLHKCRSNGGTTVDDGPVSSKGKGTRTQRGIELNDGEIN